MATTLEDRERIGAWLGGCRRLRIRYERCSECFYALAMLGQLPEFVAELLALHQLLGNLPCGSSASPSTSAAASC